MFLHGKKVCVSPLYQVVSCMTFLGKICCLASQQTWFSRGEVEEGIKQITFLDFGTDRIGSKAFNWIIRKKRSHFINEVRIWICVLFIWCTPASILFSLIRTWFDFLNTWSVRKLRKYIATNSRLCLLGSVWRSVKEQAYFRSGMKIKSPALNPKFKNFLISKMYLNA